MPLDQAAIDKEPGQDRSDQPRHNEEQTRQHHEEESKLHPRQPPAQRLEQPWRMSPGLEVGTPLKGHDVAAEFLGEVNGGDGGRSAGRVVQKDTIFFEPLEHDEVVGAPTDDQGERERTQVLAHTLRVLGRQTVAGRPLDQVAGRGPVAGNAASHAQLLQGDEPSVTGQDHRQRGGPAFNRLHLKNGGSPDAASLSLCCGNVFHGVLPCHSPREGKTK